MMENQPLLLLNALNTAATTIQRSAVSEEAVFEAVRDQFASNGLRGGVSFLDEKGEFLTVMVVAQPSLILSSLEEVQRKLNIRAEGFRFKVSQVDVYRKVIDSGQAEFVPDGSQVMIQILPQMAKRFTAVLSKLFGTTPGIYAPLIGEKGVFGIVNILGANLTEAELPVMQAFANHIAVALQNAKLFDELRQSEERYRKLFEFTPDGIAVHSEGKLVLVNPAGAKIMGADKPEDLVGRQVLGFVHPAFHKLVLQRIRNTIESGNPSPLVEEQFVRLDGSLVDVEVANMPLTFQGKPAVQVVVRDITERKRIEEDRKKFALGIERSDEAIFITDPDERIEYINPAFERLYGYSKGEAIGHTPRLLKSGMYDRDFYEQFWEKLLSKETVVCELVNRAKDGYLVTVLSSANPILNMHGELVGYLVIQRDITNRKKAEEELAEAYEAAIEGWSRALALRDDETWVHTDRVTELTLELASKFGFVEGDLIHIRRGALLHDIGKMGISDTILNKPGPLSEEEWMVMRWHPIFAYDLLSAMPYLKSAIDIPYCHHERWDGSGYPRGLKGKEIPLAARIFAVVDVYDALCSDRPYREAWKESEARIYLQDNAGKQFDPQVVKMFQSLIVNS